jgi:hypothetical protein
MWMMKNNKNTEWQKQNKYRGCGVVTEGDGTKQKQSGNKYGRFRVVKDEATKTKISSGTRKKNKGEAEW